MPKARPPRAENARRANLRDVAQAANASIATVSRVLGGSDYPVSEPLRARILEAAHRLHYVPNAVGKSLKTRISHDLGVIMPSLTNPYYATLIQGAYDEANQKGYHIIFCSVSRSARAEAQAIDRLMQKRVDGILLASIHSDLAAVQRAMASGCSVVAMDQPLPLSCLQVGFDFRKGASMATEHLIEQGHRDIGFLGAPLDRPSRRHMLEGFRSALARNNLAVREDWVLLCEYAQEAAGSLEIAGGAAGAQAFLAMRERPTAYVCLNDMTAFGAMQAFQAAGLRLPQDASLIGFDNLPFCQIASPALTTIDQHAYDMGKLATRLLIERLEQPSSPQISIQLEPTLVVRCSVCPR